MSLIGLAKLCGLLLGQVGAIRPAFRAGEFNPEGASRSDLAVDSNGAAQLLGELLRYGETDPDAFGRDHVIPVKASERIEDQDLIGLGYAAPRVRHLKPDPLGGDDPGRQCDLSTFRGVFDTVGQQIEQDLVDPNSVRSDMGQAGRGRGNSDGDRLLL